MTYVSFYSFGRSFGRGDLRGYLLNGGALREKKTSAVYPPARQPPATQLLVLACAARDSTSVMVVCLVSGEYTVSTV